MARSSTRGRGDSPKDEAFVEWMEEQGQLEPIDPSADDIPFPAKMRWTGDNDEDDSPWKIPPPGRRCRGTAYVRDPDGDYILDAKNNRVTRPCYNWPMKGMSVCLFHGGGVKRVKMKAVERLASALDAVTGALVKIAMDERVPAKDRISAINSIMDRVGVRGGMEVDIKDPGYLDVLKGLFEGKKSQQSSEES